MELFESAFYWHQPRQLRLSVSKSKPAGQRHLKDPKVFSHLWLHCADPSMHSSISAILNFFTLAAFGLWSLTELFHRHTFLTKMVWEGHLGEYNSWSCFPLKYLPQLLSRPRTSSFKYCQIILMNSVIFDNTPWHTPVLSLLYPLAHVQW